MVCQPYVHILDSLNIVGQSGLRPSALTCILLIGHWIDGFGWLVLCLTVSPRGETKTNVNPDFLVGNLPVHYGGADRLNRELHLWSGDETA